MVPELFGILAKLGIHSGRISFSPTTLNILISSDISTTLSTFMGPSVLNLQYILRTQGAAFIHSRSLNVARRLD